MDEFPEAEVYLDDDGDLCLDWYGKNAHRVVSVSISQSGMLNYAWLCNGESGHGVARPTGTVPGEILNALRRIYADQAP